VRCRKMPNIKSAKKKLRQDIKRTKQHDLIRKKIKQTIKSAAKEKQGEVFLKKAFSVIDKAVKKRVIHKNKAARLKSSISKLFNKKK
jgi:small subunit ribosomal protein S20